MKVIEMTGKTVEEAKAEVVEPKKEEKKDKPEA